MTKNASKTDSGLPCQTPNLFIIDIELRDSEAS